MAQEILLGFFERFAAVCADWRPQPVAILAARAAASADAAAAEAGAGGKGSSGRVQLQVVTGCSGGHPRALLGAAVERLERTPQAFAAAATEAAAGTAGDRAWEGAAAASAAGATGAASPLLQAGGLPLLRALQVLLRSQHNRAVLCSLGLLPALCELVRQLAQKLQAASGVLAVRSSSGNLDAAAASQLRPSRSGSQLRLLQPLLALLQEVLALVQAFAEYETAQRREAAVVSSKLSSKAASHAAQAAAQEAALAAAAASVAAQTTSAVAPLVERGLAARCCELLPVLLRVRLHSSSDGSASKSAEQEQALEAAVAALERQALGCLLALQAASPAGAAAALVQQQGGQSLALLVQLLGWPLASAGQQLPLASAASSSSSLVAEQPTPDEQQQQQHASSNSSNSRCSSYVRVNSGDGLRPAGEELRLQLLALRVLGAAARSGGGVCLRLLQQQGCFARLTQLQQWAALTFDSAPAGGKRTEAAAVGAGSEDAPQGSAELEQLVLALWGWVSGGSGSGAAKALLPLLLGSVLGAFRPAAAAEAPAGSGGQRQQQQQQEQLRQQLSSSDLLFHEAAAAALCGGAASGSHCGCGLQRQALLLGARLLGREQRLLPLLPPAGAGLQDQIIAGSGGLASTEALANLQALRAAGRRQLNGMPRLPLALGMVRNIW